MSEVTSSLIRTVLAILVLSYLSGSNVLDVSTGVQADLAIQPAAAASCPGRLDGVVLTDIPEPIFDTKAIVDAEDNIFIAVATYRTFMLMRYDANGRLDTSFGNGGIARTSILAGRHAGWALAQDSRGRTLVAGGVEEDASSGNSTVAIVRYTATGALDASFGQDGAMLEGGSTTEFFSSRITSIALDQADNIIAAVEIEGYSVSFEDNEEAEGYEVREPNHLVRYTPDGELDATFGEEGVAQLIFDSDRSPDAVELRPQAMTLDADGNILVTGRSKVGDRDSVEDDFAVARFTAQGMVDTTFGDGGIVWTDFAEQEDSALSIELDSSGHIVVGGIAGIIGFTQVAEPDIDFGLVRYTQNGALDTSFGENGKVHLGFPATEDGYRNDFGRSIVVDSNDRIAMVGNNSKLFIAGDAIGLIRFTSNGALDSTFGENGIVRYTNPRFNYFELHDVLLDSSENIIAVGKDFYGPVSVALLRYSADGTFDESFGTATGQILNNCTLLPVIQGGATSR